MDTFFHSYLLYLFSLINIFHSFLDKNSIKHTKRKGVYKNLRYQNSFFFFFKFPILSLIIKITIIFHIIIVVIPSVNNVGMQYLYPMYMMEVPESTVWDLINVNVGATTHMTKLVLPGMQKRKRGAIVNVSSSAELQPMPLMAVYAATKVEIPTVL